MRSLEKNKRLIYYANPEAPSEIIDEDGNYTGEKEYSYGAVTAIRLNVSASKGNIHSAPFGDVEDYDRVISITDEPITVTGSTLFWIDTLDASAMYDYTVKAIADSLNGKLVAVKKEKVSLVPEDEEE